MSAADRIRVLNDVFRTTFIGGRVLLSPGVTALPASDQSAVLQQVQTFTAFSQDNDPYAEHDFGAIEHQGGRYFWKIDYYDLAMTGGSGDPGDPAVTTRVLTIMCADEY